MKLATLKDGSRDGKLVVVSRDLKKCIIASGIAKTMQVALDNWQDIEPKLQEVYIGLNQNEVADSFDFNASACMSPLPRAYQWADGSAYVNHVELVRQARGVKMPESFWHDPLMYQGGSDAFIGPCDDILVERTDFGIDFEAELAVITGDVAMAADAKTAKENIRLFMLVNDVSLRNLIPAELAKGFGFFQSKPSSSFSPVAITADELADAWDGEKVHLPMTVHLNDELFGQPNAGVDMTFNFPELVSHAAKTRALAAGAIVGSGTVSNVDRSVGYCCLAEKRMLEIIDQGEAKTDFMQFGDRVRIEMFNSQGQSLFGAINQRVIKYDK
ncbi:2-keto-4-pentenoate hydratase [Piscirickettsia salmonis]|uniref:Ureidoglycolate lyase n=1 Tax=Piscirickettsia salmonis TaxID=1238 RepID=A0A9Q6LVR1_PISSA|nr:fumarylacetoacetate hydrolase family protein [Piscirickettsia salmonis]ALA23679.1 fumarylacetoacetate (FAA) hydrolase family protein [Piscirickettsia salmonis]APS44118.1 2-keto-4-pentenoate hydratase [Piscirickettsia salmonis]APS47479.1 2-keto-4-pentenoate hydratase [Piscirickettsia salmonis]APS51086.1 2-keto-4-pentenoate hydratase [Piscirickettsia salmonis]APS54294.1 2-keto-4-pentenoate hydratase [Piscirickettsia salmonis]